MLAQRAKSAARVPSTSVSAPISSTLSDTDPASQCVPAQAQIVQLAKLGAAAEHVIADRFDRTQNRQSTAGKHQDIAPQTWPDQLVQRGARAKQLAREPDLMAHQRDERRSGGSCAQLFDRIAKAGHIAARQIYSALAEIDRDILPEIGQLQTAADAVGQLLAARVAKTEQ